MNTGDKREVGRATQSTLKTKIEETKVRAFLEGKFDGEITGLEPIAAGEISQCFFFEANGEQYVIRVNKKNEGFKKDAYAAEHFGGVAVPIPESIEVGELGNELSYSINKRVPGTTVDRVNPEVKVAIVPAVISTLDAIHSTPVTQNGYGDWDENGTGKNKSWNEYLSAHHGNFFKGKDKEMPSPFFERDVFERLALKYKSLIPSCPEIRQLVHGDYGFNNALSDGQTITGVIDWEHSKYGDFLYDVAWLSFWEREIDYKEIFRKHYEEKGIAIPNYDERILCYILHFGLGVLYHFANSNQERLYNESRDRLLILLSDMK